jgi:uncharacterized protein YndB with AHSA1/START domain
MTGSRILVALRVAASPEHAFDVFTKEIGSWWQPNVLFRFTPRSPGVVRFEGGEGGRFVEELPNGKVFEIGRVRAWEPGSRLVFGWRQATFARDQDTEVEVRFEPVGEETRVTVEHRGWDSVPKEHVARHGFASVLFLRRHGEWWQALLERMNQAARSEGPQA